MVQRIVAGQVWSPYSARDWNSIGEATEFVQRHFLGNGGDKDFVPIPTDIIKLKNESGANLVAGRVLEVGLKLLTTMSRKQLWFSGSEPDENYKKIWGVSVRPIVSNAIDYFQVSGLAYARININHVQHNYCDVIDGSTILQSKWNGMASIVATATESTGEQDCAILLRDPFLGPVDITITEPGGIAVDSAGEVTIRDASPTATEQAWLDWMHGGTSIDEGVEAVMFYYRKAKQWRIRARGCATA